MACEIFLIGHELAHVYADHLEPAVTKTLKALPAATEDLEFYQLSQQQEFQADELSWEWYQQTVQRDSLFSGIPGLRYAPFYFLLMALLVEKSVGEADPYSTHPSALERMRHLLLGDARCGASQETLEVGVELFKLGQSMPVLAP